MATTAELDALVARANTTPGVAEVLRVYGAAQQATYRATAVRPTVRATMGTSTNFSRR